MLSKFYSLDECQDQEKVFSHLDKLVNDGKLFYEEVETDIIKLRDEGMSVKEKKDLIKFLEANDVIDYNEMDEEDEEDEEDLSDYSDLDDDDIF